ncbi:MAG: glycine cleavage system protein GcvH [Desulfuromonadales bacterium]|nr:glycine cleavage system protein GcvH [Desulfuromonadales bacterium]
MEIRDELKYSEDHEWILVEEGIATIGISDFAQDAMGDVVFVELPEVGSNIDAGKTFGVVESVKAVSDLYAPVSGEVVEVNEGLPDAPDSVNSSPYDDAWMVKIKLSDAAQVEALMDAEAYRSCIAEQ